MIWILVLLACGEGGDDSATETCGRTPPLTYENFGQGFLRSHCTGCHGVLLPEEQREGAPLGVDFDTWGDVLNWAERIEIRTAEETMPPGGGPSAEERAKLAEWMACDVAEGQ